MDAEGVPYASPRDFERTLTDRLANAGASSPYGVQELRRQFAYLVFAAVAWRRGFWGLAGRIHYSLVALAGVVVVWSVVAWQFI